MFGKIIEGANILLTRTICHAGRGIIRMIGEGFNIRIIANFFNIRFIINGNIGNFLLDYQGPAG